MRKTDKNKEREDELYIYLRSSGNGAVYKTSTRPCLPVIGIDQKYREREEGYECEVVQKMLK